MRRDGGIPEDTATRPVRSVVVDVVVPRRQANARRSLPRAFCVSAGRRRHDGTQDRAASQRPSSEGEGGEDSGGR